MTDIFSSQPGRLIAFPTHYKPPVLFTLEDAPSDVVFKALITGVTIQSQISVQFQHSLDWGIFVSLFGRRVTDVTVTGLTFGLNCLGGDDDEGDEMLDGTHGAQYVQDYYDNFEANARETPVTMVIGTDTAWECYLISLAQALNDPDAGVGRFAMKLVALP